MISSSRQAVACILLLWPTIIFAQSQTASDKELNGTVSGKVTVKGDAVSGVVVGLISGDRRVYGSAVQKAVTDDEGNYRINDVKPGTYELAVASLTYVIAGSTYARKALIVGKGEVIENVNFNLARGGVITGKVTDSEGRPVIEINIKISPAQLDHLSSIRPSLRTDDRGIYRAFGLPPGGYIISAGHEEQSMLGEGLTRYGHKLTYHPAAAQRSQATIIEVTEGSESTGIDIALGRPTIRYFASGRIVDGETGKPVANVRYGVSRFVRQKSGGFHSGGKATNEQGEFKLHNLSPGSYAIVAEGDAGPDLRVEPHRFEVVDRDVTGLIVKTTKGGSVSGVIILEETDFKAPPKLDRTSVIAFVVTRNEVRELNRMALAKADGTFRIGGLPGGEVRLWVSPGKNNLQLIRVEHDGVVYSRGFEIKELEHLTGVRLFVASANGMVRGLVKLANGSPPPENRVSVMVRRLSDVDPEGGMMRGAQVDTRGEFVVDRLLPGTYEVTVINSATPFENPNSKSKRAIQQIVVTNDNVTSVTLTLPEQ